MFYNYIKIAVRNLQRNKFFNSINILGLSLGLAIALLIIVFIQHELSYDQFIDQKENIYRVYRNWSKTNERVVWTPSRLAEKLKNDFPEVLASTGLSPGREQLMEYKNEKFYAKKTASVDSSFFHTIPMPLKYGHMASAMDQPNAIVISNGLSEKIFGEINPVGQVISVGEVELQVTGVVNLDKKLTHLDYDAFTRFTWYSDSWVSNNRSTYVRLDPNTHLAGLEDKITENVNKLSLWELLAGNLELNEKELAEWKLQPLLDIYLYSSGFSWMANKKGDIRTIYIFLLIAVLVLIVAIVNYINLATAMAGKRSKEVGVRKVTGALRSQLFGQFMAEALFQVMLACALALLLAQALLPFFNTVSGRDLHLLGINPLGILGLLFCTTVITGLLSGIYPAIVLSGFKPISALKSNFLRARKKDSFRKLLVVGQFTITISFLLIMVFIFRQIKFMMQHELGFQPEQVIDIPLNANKSHYKVLSLKSAMNAIPGVNNVSTASSLPGQSMPDWGMIIEGQPQTVSPYVIFADEDYYHTLGLKLVNGRFLSDEIALDSVDNFVVNETFVRQYNLKTPLGTKVKFTSEKRFGHIVGIVKDYHFRGLQHPIAPLIINGNHRRRHVAIQLSTDNLPFTIFELEKLWTEIEPEHSMRYTFLDEDFGMQYAAQNKLGKTMLYATILILFMAILGLYGLTMFTVIQRKKEIGIRKVLGATTANIVGFLSMDFLKLILIACGLAIHIGWYVTSRWLEDFAFRTEIVWWVFLLVGLITMLVAFSSMSTQAIKAAISNPVKSLKND